MSSPRKFADKIALMQQKQAEGDVAFNTIICEVGEAKQVSGPKERSAFFALSLSLRATASESRHTHNL